MYKVTAIVSAICLVQVITCAPQFASESPTFDEYSDDYPNEESLPVETSNFQTDFSDSSLTSDDQFLNPSTGGFITSDQFGAIPPSDQFGVQPDQFGGDQSFNQFGGAQPSNQFGGVQPSDQFGGGQPSDQFGGVQPSDQSFNFGSPSTDQFGNVPTGFDQFGGDQPSDQFGGDQSFNFGSASTDQFGNLPTGFDQFGGFESEPFSTSDFQPGTDDSNDFVTTETDSFDQSESFNAPGSDQFNNFQISERSGSINDTDVDETVTDDSDSQYDHTAASRFVRSPQAPSGVVPTFTDFFAAIVGTHSEPENVTESAVLVEEPEEGNSTYSIKLNDTDTMSKEDDEINAGSSSQNSSTFNNYPSVHVFSSNKESEASPDGEDEHESRFVRSPQSTIGSPSQTGYYSNFQYSDRENQKENDTSEIASEDSSTDSTLAIGQFQRSKLENDNEGTEKNFDEIVTATPSTFGQIPLIYQSPAYPRDLIHSNVNSDVIHYDNDQSGNIHDVSPSHIRRSAQSPVSFGVDTPNAHTTNNDDSVTEYSTSDDLNSQEVSTSQSYKNNYNPNVDSASSSNIESSHPSVSIIPVSSFQPSELDESDSDNSSFLKNEPQSSLFGQDQTVNQHSETENGDNDGTVHSFSRIVRSAQTDYYPSFQVSESEGTEKSSIGNDSVSAIESETESPLSAGVPYSNVQPPTVYHFITIQGDGESGNSDVSNTHYNINDDNSTDHKLKERSAQTSPISSFGTDQFFADEASKVTETSDDATFESESVENDTRATDSDSHTLPPYSSFGMQHDTTDTPSYYNDSILTSKPSQIDINQEDGYVVTIDYSGNQN